MSEQEKAPAQPPNGDVTNGSSNDTPNGDAEKQGKVEKGKEQVENEKDNKHDKKEKKDDEEPAGGFDATPIPRARDGYTIKFTFHRAENLPMSDLNTRSSDPFILATMTSAMPKRHKEDPDLVLRTPTVHKNTNPEWNAHWIVAGIPSSGFKLKCRLYDEDAADHDDRLGNVTIHVNHIDRNWRGIQEERFDIKKRMGSKRAYFIRGCAAMLSSNVHMSGSLYVSAEILGESEPPHGRMYTIGDTAWIKHYSPMIGRIAGTKAPEGDHDGNDDKATKYDFQANEFQLKGPVPAELYHRFVEFKGFVKGMFSSTGIRGRILNKALHHQHARVYNFSNSTEYGIVPPHSKDATLQFLKMVHFDEGGRIFTYVLTLDGLLRFTETGKEFGIDLLSKHTMHSDVNIYIACSGEFFVRRLAHPHQSADAPGQQTHPDADLPGGPPHAPPPQEPETYELVIDNDSGTYRPKASLLPLLKGFLNANFPGLHVVVMDGFDEKLGKWKEQQRERKKKEGQNVVLVQNSDEEISSSDEEALDGAVGGGGRKTGKQRAFDALEDPRGAIKGLKPSGKTEGEGQAQASGT